MKKACSHSLLVGGRICVGLQVQGLHVSRIRARFSTVSLANQTPCPENGTWRLRPVAQQPDPGDVRHSFQAFRSDTPRSLTGLHRIQQLPYHTKIVRLGPINSQLVPHSQEVRADTRDAGCSDQAAPTL